MSEDDLINLQHQVDNHENELTDQTKEMVALKGQISDLKKDIANLLVLARCLYQISGSLPQISVTSENARAELLKLLPEMNERYGIKYPV
jgi:hypothetical protein